MARLFDRSRKGGKYGGSPSVSAVDVDSSGVVEGVSAAAASTILQEHPTTVEIGHPGVWNAAGTAGNAAATLTVPAGKVWRLIGAAHALITDATVANRAVVFTTQDTDDTEIEALTHANVAASTTVYKTTLFGTDDYTVGNKPSKAEGTLTMDTKPTADDTIVLNGVTFTWVAALTGAANELLIGADVAASKAAIKAAFLDRDNGGVLHSVSDAVFESIEMSGYEDWDEDEFYFLANVAGTAGDALATTETFTAVSNVFDAATLGDVETGLDAADIISALDYPDAGVLLTAGEDLVVSVTNGVAGDELNLFVFYLEFDADPT